MFIFLGTYSCKCRKDFILSPDGHSCMPLGICAENPCYNNGKCVIDKHSFHCECEKGFTGRLCHQQVEFELPDFLNIRKHWWRIRFCKICKRWLWCHSVRVGDHSCYPNPCLNGGKCFAFKKMDAGQFVCACSKQFTGNKCQHGYSCMMSFFLFYFL